jgi:hypothetical protein
MNTKNLLNRVRAKLGAEPLSAFTAAAHCGISTANALYYLNQLVEAGEAVQETQVVHHTESNASSRRYTFRLTNPAEPEAPVPVTLPAYRNLRLSETLTGYESSLFGFASLCMTVRR